jgi:DNA-binding transcriptional LysR family regulator
MVVSFAGSAYEHAPILEIVDRGRMLIRIRMSSIDWNLARAFRATAASGSLTAAARQLGLTQPTLSRQVAELERSLGITLFERVGKRLVLTNAGLGLLEHAEAMATAAETMALAAAGRSQDIAGRVTISAGDILSAYLLPDLVARIRQKAPQITLVVVASNSISDLRRREADIAIRHVRPTEPDLIARLAREMTAHLYAAESWVARHGMPGSVADIADTELLGFEPAEQFVEHLKGLGVKAAPERLPIVSESAIVIWEMLRRGLGVGMMLSEVAERTAGVVRLLPELPGTPVPCWLVSHRELRNSRRVRLVFETLAEGL